MNPFAWKDAVPLATDLDGLEPEMCFAGEHQNVGL